jgi:hypothetical protein
MSSSVGAREEGSLVDIFCWSARFRVRRGWGERVGTAGGVHGQSPAHIARILRQLASKCQLAAAGGVRRGFCTLDRILVGIPLQLQLHADPLLFLSHPILFPLLYSH